MSVSFWMYRTPGFAPAMTLWESDRSLPIEPAASVKERLTLLFPLLMWETDLMKVGKQLMVFHSASQRDKSPECPCVELWFRVEKDGFVHFISARKARPSVLIKIMKTFELNSVYQDQSGESIDPKLFNEAWELKQGMCKNGRWSGYSIGANSRI